MEAKGATGGGFFAREVWNAGNDGLANGDGRLRAGSFSGNRSMGAVQRLRAIRTRFQATGRLCPARARNHTGGRRSAGARFEQADTRFDPALCAAGPWDHPGRRRPGAPSAFRLER